MNPEDKKEEPQSNQSPQPGNNTGKLQRKLKFKTLDGNIKNLECDYDIKISELKKKISRNIQNWTNSSKAFK